jgi:integrase
VASRLDASGAANRLQPNRSINVDRLWVFHYVRGKRLKTFYKARASACERANVVSGMFHDLRQSAVRNMVRAGIQEKMAIAIGGHKTRHVFDRYNIVVRQGSG